MKALRKSLTAAAAFGVAAAFSTAAPPAQKPKKTIDMRKSIVESPLKKLIARQNPTTAADRRSAVKKAIEALKATSEPKAATPGLSTTTDFKNPKVQPGLVRWHDDFEKARAAAKKSRKPVLLFHLIGRLDERFS